MNNKNNKNNAQPTLSSTENFNNFKKNNHLRVKRGNDETLVEATAKGHYNYWLNQDDLNEIIRLEYNHYASKVIGTKKYEILTSLTDLKIHLETFLLKTKQFTEMRLTLLIQLENLHWVTLVISYQNENTHAYYTDSKNVPLAPEYFQLLFDQFKIQPMSLSPGFQQQIEAYNCGLWALENADSLNRMLDENQSFNWLINQLQLLRSKEYFIKKRKFFAEKLRSDPGWRKKNPIFMQEFNRQRDAFSSSFRRISATSLERDDAKRLKLLAKDEKEKIIILLDIFVETFMSFFSKNLGCWLGIP